MKILTVSDIYYPHPGGIPEHIYHTYKEFKKLGHEVKILTTHYKVRSRKWEVGSEKDIIRIGRIFYVPANRSIGGIAIGSNLSKRVKDFIRSSNFDVIHIHGFGPTLSLLALRYSNSINVATFHASYEKNNWYALGQKFLLPYFNKIDCRIAVSEEARKSINMYFPADYRIIPNGIDIQRFNPNIEPFSSLLLPPSSNVLFVGRFEPRKGLNVLLKAFPIVLNELPETRLVIVGKGKLPITNYQLPITIRTDVPPEDIPRYYTSSTVFVSPATGNESFGIVLLEAMATAKPIVASDIPGYRSAIDNGKEGILVPPNNPSLLACAIIKLLKNPEIRKEMGKRGRQKAESYSWDKIVKEIEGIYYESL
jgi:phosphatidylinositol alpha-mannosyltransferase